MTTRWLLVVLIATTTLTALLVTTVFPLWAAEPDSSVTKLTELSLEELMNIEVTSVSKKAQPLAGTAAAIYVLTGDDIRRSGATTITDALRLVPGTHVGRIDANTWGITTRGFNGRYANKMLVLVDGRSVYLPLFSGVYWEHQDMVLDNIERIEIIRGPGGTLWGANAVNGIINIITKSAKDTQGGLVEIAAGTQEERSGTARYGGRLAENAWFRLYAKTYDRSESFDQLGTNVPNDWNIKRIGYRIDWELSDQDTLTFQSDYYKGEASGLLVAPSYDSPLPVVLVSEDEREGANLMARWHRELSDDQELVLQAYYDYTMENVITFDRTTSIIADVDFQHRFRPHDRHEIVWGAGCRRTNIEAPGTVFFDLNEPERTVLLYSAFLQDEIALAPERLSLTLGSKFEHNGYSGFDYLPSARVTWNPAEHQTVWAAASRAVRTPSRVDVDLRLTSPPPAPGVYPRLMGNEEFDSEVLLAYELGYRVQPTPHVTLDATLFYQDYDNLRSIEPGLPFLETSPGPPHLIAPLYASNLLEGQAYGFELAANWQGAEWWLVRSGYSLFQLDLQPDPASLDTIESSAEDEAPRNMAFVRSSMDLPGSVALDLMLRYVDTIPAFDVDSYLELDARIAWRPNEQLELFVVGRSLLDDRHKEYASKYVSGVAKDVERGVYAGITWRF